MNLISSITISKLPVSMILLCIFSCAFGDSVMLSNAKIFTMENSRVIERGDILVRGGLIIEVGEGLRPPNKPKEVHLSV